MVVEKQLNVTELKSRGVENNDKSINSTHSNETLLFSTWPQLVPLKR